MRKRPGSDLFASDDFNDDGLFDFLDASVTPLGSTGTTGFAAEHTPELTIWTTEGGPDAMAAGGKGGGGVGGGGKGGSSGGSTSTGGSGGSTASFVSGSATTTWRSLDPCEADKSLPTDTYFGQQWSLISTRAGIDVKTAWHNYTGAGIKIGVIDDGIDYNHRDLNPNYLFNLDYDAVSGGNDGAGPSTAGHGTTVAGILGAARDGTGIVGVAYDAGLASFRISYTTGGPSQLADALNHLVLNDMDVGNASWGYSTPYQDNFNGSWSSSRTAIQNAVSNGRDGLGINIVFSAGNNRPNGDDVNYHNYQNSPYVITVAATDDFGFLAPFSTPGAAVLVSAPGSSLITDDRSGSAGWSSGDYFSVSGTSYSAPIVSGIIALMLQANPNLGYRDVQEILAYSAEQTDRANPSWTINGAHDWNGGGLHFSQDLGFGLVNATAAVRLAESWQYQSTFANMASATVSHTDNLRIPDGAGTLQSQINLTNTFELDKVVVDLNISHGSPKDLVVTLTSPGGTTATLTTHPANGTGSGIVFSTSANNFWGENAQGNWTLTVTDTVGGNVGTLNGWTLKALGDATETPAVYIYTDEFATMAGTDRAVLHDLSERATINTAAVTTSSHLDLNPGAFGTIAGRSLQIGFDTTIKNLWAGDGDDVITGNSSGNTIQAGRGNDIIRAGQGADKFYGGPGDDKFVFELYSTNIDIIADFAPGDTIDLQGALSSLGYAGADALADGWLTLTADGNGGTFFVIDPHDGRAAVTLIDVVGVASTMLREGYDYWTIV